MRRMFCRSAIGGDRQGGLAPLSPPIRLAIGLSAWARVATRAHRSPIRPLARAYVLDGLRDVRSNVSTPSARIRLAVHNFIIHIDGNWLLVTIFNRLGLFPRRILDICRIRRDANSMGGEFAYIFRYFCILLYTPKFHLHNTSQPYPAPARVFLYGSTVESFSERYNKFGF